MAGTDEPTADGLCNNNELQRTRDYLHAIISGSLDGIAVFNEQQELEYVNDAGCQFMGVAREQLMGRHFSAFVPPESREFYQQKWEQAMAARTVPYEGKILRTDGSIVSVLISDKVITVEGRKKCVTIVKDISELKATQNALQRTNESLAKLVETRTAELSGAVTERDNMIEALRRSEEEFRHLVNYAGFIVVRCSLDGTLHFMNDMGLQYGGRRSMDVAGKHMQKIWGPVMTQMFMGGMRQAIEKGKDIELEIERPGRSGTRWFWARYNLMKDAEGRPESVIFFAHDITKQKLAEMQLRESEEKHRQLVETAGLVMAVWDLEGRMQFVNGLGASFLRCRPQDVLGKHVTEVFGPVIGGSFLRAMQRIIEIGFDDEHVTEMPLPGGVRWFWSKGTLLRDGAGTATAVAVFARDVTESRLAQQKVAESEERYRNLIENSGLAITYHGVDGRLVLLNSLAASYLGGRPEDFVGKRLKDVIGSPTGEMMDEMALRAIEEGHEIDNTGDLLLPVGRRFMWARFTIVRNADGGVAGVVVFAHDRTEQTLAEHALQESESRRRMLTDMAMEAIFMHDDGILLEANPKFYEMFGYQPEEIMGKDIRPLTLAPESVETIVNHYRNAQGVSIQAVAIRKDGTRFPMETRGIDTRYKGRKVRVGVITDISDRVKAEAELAEIREKMAATERLAAVGYIGATMAHEVNTPLSVMRLTLQALIAELEKGGGRKVNLEQAGTILREIDRVSSIVRRYREMSRPAREIGDNADEIRAVPERVKRVFLEAAHNVRLQITIGDEVPELLTKLGNVNDAEQLMFVLVQNAVQAADSQKRETLHITGCIRDKNAELRFADNCCGIPPENLAKIFEPFFSTKPRNIGTGLGLSIVRRLLQERGGSIRVESEPGKGTTFIVTYPA